MHSTRFRVCAHRWYSCTSVGECCALARPLLRGIREAVYILKPLTATTSAQIRHQTNDCMTSCTLYTSRATDSRLCGSAGTPCCQIVIWHTRRHPTHRCLRGTVEILALLRVQPGLDLHRCLRAATCWPFLATHSTAGRPMSQLRSAHALDSQTQPVSAAVEALGG